MSNFRIIPTLLLKKQALVKGINFSNHTYVGDPINAVRIFNAKMADELFFFDIDATKNNNSISLKLVEKLANECYMPFAVGGGISKIENIIKLVSLGVEKVSINTCAVRRPNFIKEASEIFGSQAIVVCIDSQKNSDGSYSVVTESGRKIERLSPLAHAKNMERMGAGEIIINSLDKDGTFTGLDKELIYSIAPHLKVPVIAMGGTGSLENIKDLKDTKISSAVAVGSFFTFYGPHRAVLINYPDKDEEIFK